DLLARLIELVHRPGFAEACSQLSRSFGGRLRFGQEVNELTRSNGAIVSALCLVRDTKRFFGSAELRLMKAFRGDLGARRHGRERDDIGDELHLAFERRPRLDTSPGKRWIGRKALSDPFGVGYGEFVVCRL